MRKQHIPQKPPRPPYTAVVEVGKRKYRLQHPGAREWIKLQSEVMDFDTKKVDLTALMDYCFEHVVTPIGHDYQPDLDDLHPADSEVWGSIFLPFLRGASVTKFAPKKDVETDGTIAESPAEEGGITPG